MKKFVIASHGGLAKGLETTLSLFVSSDVDITYISAYLDETVTLDQQISDFLATVGEADQIIAFTDLYGGSVNQRFAQLQQERSDLFIITGFNVPLLLEVLLSTEPVTTESLDQLVEATRQELKQVKVMQPENNEADFFE